MANLQFEEFGSLGIRRSRSDSHFIAGAVVSSAFKAPSAPFERSNSDKLFHSGHKVPGFGTTPKGSRKQELLNTSSKKEVQMAKPEPKEELKDCFSFGEDRSGASEPGEQDFQQAINAQDRLQLRQSIMSIKNPKIPKLQMAEMPVVRESEVTHKLTRQHSNSPQEFKQISDCQLNETPNIKGFGQESPDSKSMKSARTNEQVQSDLQLEFRGTESAQQLNEEGGFSHLAREQDSNRVVDLIFFFHGTALESEKFKVLPTLTHDKTQLFEVPEGVRIYEYYSQEEGLPSLQKEGEQATEPAPVDLMKYILLKQDLVRGAKVKPASVSGPGEPCIDRTEFYQCFNGSLIGEKLTSMKITITSDQVDCGRRKVAEEITLEKYHDFEQFSFRSVVSKMRKNLENDVFLRIHLISNIQFTDDAQGDDDYDRVERELEMEEHQIKKKNHYLEFLTAFTHNHPVPTKNVNLISVHEKNEALQQRVEELQKTSKNFLHKNLQINVRHDKERRQFRNEIEDLTVKLAEAEEKLKFSEEKCAQLMNFCQTHLQAAEEKLVQKSTASSHATSKRRRRKSRAKEDNPPAEGAEEARLEIEKPEHSEPQQLKQQEALQKQKQQEEEANQILSEPKLFPDLDETKEIKKPDVSDFCKSVELENEAKMLEKIEKDGSEKEGQPSNPSIPSEVIMREEAPADEGEVVDFFQQKYLGGSENDDGNESELSSPFQVVLETPLQSDLKTEDKVVIMSELEEARRVISSAFTEGEGGEQLRQPPTIEVLAQESPHLSISNYQNTQIMHGQGEEEKALKVPSPVSKGLSPLSPRTFNNSDIDDVMLGRKSDKIEVVSMEPGDDEDDISPEEEKQEIIPESPKSIPPEEQDFKEVPKQTTEQGTKKVEEEAKSEGRIPIFTPDATPQIQAYHQEPDEDNTPEPAIEAPAAQFETQPSIPPQAPLEMQEDLMAAKRKVAIPKVRQVKEQMAKPITSPRVLQTSFLQKRALNTQRLTKGKQGQMSLSSLPRNSAQLLKQGPTSSHHHRLTDMSQSNISMPQGFHPEAALGVEMQSTFNATQEINELQNLLQKNDLETSYSYSYMGDGDLGLHGKPVLNTINQCDVSIDTRKLQQTIEQSVVGIDISEKVLKFKEKALKRQLEKQAAGPNRTAPTGLSKLLPSKVSGWGSSAPKKSGKTLVKPSGTRI